MLKLTETNGSALWIGTQHIVAMRQQPAYAGIDAFTELYCPHIYNVRETPEEIVAMISAADGQTRDR